jgi:hypothetical protein
VPAPPFGMGSGVSTVFASPTANEFSLAPLERLVTFNAGELRRRNPAALVIRVDVILIFGPPTPGTLGRALATYGVQTAM